MAGNLFMRERSRYYIWRTLINAKIYLTVSCKANIALQKTTSIPLLFCPDLVICRFTKNAFDWHTRNKVEFSEKIEHPADCPELHPIENIVSKRH